MPAVEQRLQSNTIKVQDASKVEIPPRAGTSMVLHKTGKCILFGGAALEYGTFGDIWWLQLDQDGNQSKWLEWQRKSDDVWPLDRYEHACHILGESNWMLVFGGTTADGMLLNDTWLFDMRQGKWSLLSTVGDIPKGRTCHQSTIVIQQADRDEPQSNETEIFSPATSLQRALKGWYMIVYGGGSVGSVAVDDSESNEQHVFVLDLSSGVWLKYSNISATAPSSRLGHSLVCSSDNSIFLFGGLLKDCAVSNELWQLVLNIEERTVHWDRISTAADPAPRTGHSLIQLPDTKYLLLRGGIDISRRRVLDSSHIFDLESRKWHPVVSQGEYHARFNASVVALSPKKVLYFGGMDFYGVYNDLYTCEMLF